MIIYPLWLGMMPALLKSFFEQVFRPGFAHRTDNNCLRVVTGEARSAGVASKALHVRHRDHYLAILEAARKEGCDLIVMASHGRRGLAELLLGSETVKVLTHSEIPVLVYRRH